MAIVTFAAPVLGARGSIGGVTFGNSVSGPTMRRRQKPVFPRSDLQGERNAALGMASVWWRDRLSAPQRAGWAALAATTNFTNSLGVTYQIPGHALYVRSALAIDQAAVVNTDNAPVTATEVAPDMTYPGVAAGFIQVVTWPNHTITPAGLVQFYLSDPVPISQNHPPTKFNFLFQSLLTNFVVLPATIANLGGANSGNHYYIRALVLRTGFIPGPPPNNALGRLSFEFITDFILP